MGLKIIGRKAIFIYPGAIPHDDDELLATEVVVMAVPVLMIPSSSVTRSPLGRIQFTVIGRFIPGTGVTSHTSV